MQFLTFEPAEVLGRIPDRLKRSFAQGLEIFSSYESAEAWATADLEGSGFGPADAETLRVNAIRVRAAHGLEAGVALMNRTPLSAAGRGRAIKNAFFLKEHTQPEMLLKCLPLLRDEAEHETARKAARGGGIRVRIKP